MPDKEGLANYSWKAKRLIHGPSRQAKRRQKNVSNYTHK